MILSASPSWAAVNLQDGGFETPVVFDFSYNTLGSPWTFLGNTGIQTPPSGFSPTAPPEGSQTAFVQVSVTMPQPSGPSTVCQDVTGFILGDLYQISFQYAARAAMSALCPGCLGGNPFEIRADGALVQTFPALVVTEVYGPGSAVFKALDTTITICFVGLGAFDTDGDRTTFIDDVQIVTLPVAAPALREWMLMVAVGFVLLIGLRKLRRAPLIA